ncbi:CASKIN2 [Symbiodinium necroappetens]|uniref:CASKIN2 protein n=1 Tax=Symbiodinium necroappetens TaxID=1628268 RepID=A0A812VLT8_9DINO|nr:CASKIN2 [Symbiodinium necroappetens]
MHEESPSLGLLGYLPRPDPVEPGSANVAASDARVTSPTFRTKLAQAAESTPFDPSGSCMSEGHAGLPAWIDQVLDCRLEHAALVARQRRLQDAELEATREETQVQLRLTAFREEVLQEKKRQAFLQAALERAQAGGQAMRIASTMTSQRQEVVVGAQNQLLAGKALLSSLLREYQGRQMQEAKVSHPADSNQSGPDDDLRALQAELREIQLEMAAEQACTSNADQPADGGLGNRETVGRCNVRVETRDFAG